MTSAGRKRVLIVEDEPDTRRVLSVRLQAERFDVLEAEDGLAGVDLAAKEQPDIILMDIMMPRMDGVEAYQALKADPTTQKIPVIFVTALGDGVDPSANRIGSMKGDYWVVGKPYDPVELIRKIRTILGEPG